MDRAQLLSGFTCMVWVSACATGMAGNGRQDTQVRLDASADTTAVVQSVATDTSIRDVALGDGSDIRARDAMVDARNSDAGCPTPCGLVPSCGCNAGQSCSVSSSYSATECRPNGNAAQKYDCSRAADCGADLSCVSGVCVRHCATHDDCAGGRCVGLPGSSALRSSGFCSTPCSVGQTYDTGCPGNVVSATSAVFCFLQTRAGAGQPEYTTCRRETVASDASGWAGASCTTHADCHRGHGCFDGSCRTICVPSSPMSQPCGSGTTCRSSSLFSVDGRMVGFCL